MSKELHRISHESKGLLGFVGSLGRELKSELVEQFDGRVKDYKIDVRYNGGSSDFFELIWSYSGFQCDVLGKLALKKLYNSFELEIDRIPGVEVCTNSNWAAPKISTTELRIAADMEESVKGFLDERFGKSNFRRVNGWPIYKTEFPEEFRLEETV